MHTEPNPRAVRGKRYPDVRLWKRGLGWVAEGAATATALRQAGVGFVLWVGLEILKSRRGRASFC